MKIDKSTKKELLKRYPKNVIQRALKKATDEKELNQYLEIFLDSYYKTVMENANPYPESLYNSSGRKCFM